MVMPIPKSHPFSKTNKTTYHTAEVGRKRLPAAPIRIDRAVERTFGDSPDGPSGSHMNRGEARTEDQQTARS